MECLAMIDILVTTIVNRAANTLSIFADGQRALQPLVRIAAIALNNKMYAYIQ